jgi:putative peptide zinc metalloprotease protein
MSDTLFSPSWYRVARLQPRIRSHARFHRHYYRGQLWYVLQDHSSGRCHRLTPAAYHLAGLMDGERTTQQIWEVATARLGDEGPTQDETIRLLGLLHSADVLRCDVSPDTLELLRRSQRREQSEWWQRFLNPLSLRFPLFDPDAFLDRWLPTVRPLFGWTGALVWLAVVSGAVFLAGAHWTELSHAAGGEILGPRNLLLLGLVYPVVKALHEFGHAFAAKAWGGEVHEMGIMFLVLMPIPYVDASSASVFPEKRKRMLVGAAGMGVELFLASLALFVWLAAEPGLIRWIAYDAMLIGGVSTLLFNGNPLLKFDGYYVLADAVEIPNLDGRSRQYLSYLVLHHLFGLDKVRYPVLAPGEERWFAGYGVAAFVYRLLILFGIALFVSQKFFVVGVLLALFAVTVRVAVPLIRGVAFVCTSPRLGEKRIRAVATLGGLALGILGFLFLFPVPSLTSAEGVVWPPEGAEVRAGAEGFVLRLLVEPNAVVEPGEPLILTRDPSLEARVAVLEAELRELRARHHAERTTDQVKAQITLEEVATATAALARAREQIGEVIVRSPAHGAFVTPRPADLVGRFVEHGDLIGHVVGSDVATARVVVPQSDIALVRDRTEAVEVRLSGRVSRTLPAVISRQVPAPTDRLPSRALGAAGGGRIPVDADDPDGLRTLETVFQLDVELPQEAALSEIGGRVYVRFDHGAETLGAQGYRALRRLFLRRIGV